MAPFVFIVPGLFEGPEPFEPLRQCLLGKGLPNVFITTVESTGTNAKNGSGMTMDDDISGIREDLAKVVDEAGENGVVMVAHSAGGFLGPAAMDGLSAPARKAAKQIGGVSKIVFFTGACLPVGTKHHPPPFAKVQEESGDFTCIDFDGLFFNDFSPELKAEWLSKVKNHPLGWDTECRYAGWSEVPTVYIMATEDKVIPVPWQEKIASSINAKVLKVECGHMGQLTKTEEIARIVSNEASTEQ